MTVTRIELANHIQAAFTAGPATRDNLLAYAASSHARPAVIAAIQALPDKTYPTIGDLWYHMSDAPVGSTVSSPAVGGVWPNRPPTSSTQGR